MLKIILLPVMKVVVMSQKNYILVNIVHLDLYGMLNITEIYFIHT